jgi:hypothetical protein
MIGLTDSAFIIKFFLYQPEAGTVTNPEAGFFGVPICQIREQIPTKRGTVVFFLIAIDTDIKPDIAENVNALQEKRNTRKSKKRV